MAVRKPLVVIGGEVQELPAADSLPGGGGAAPSAIPLDGWFFLVTPNRWSAIRTIGSLGEFENASGSITIPAPSNASLRQSLMRWETASAAAANSALEQSAYPSPVWRGNAAGRGGFVYRTRFAVTSAVTNQRALFGLQDYSGSYGASQSVYGLANTLGLAFDAAVDANWQITHCLSGGATKVDLGANFPINDPSAVLDVEFKCAPNAGTIAWTVKNLNSGATASGTISTNLPSNAAFLCPRVYMSNGGTAAAVSCDVMMIYGASYQG